ncbi:MAG: 6-carboxytetrahydropterin synthase [Paludibacter sp.]|nr:6-carboxytetrahydropterin synthase [Paludibacter sp.]
MHTISKEFYFSASHQLHGLIQGHPCGRIHGHNYTLRVFLKGDINQEGFVQDYNDLKPISDWVDQKLDHRHLNEVFNFQTSVENMSKYIYDLFKPQFPLLCAIEMSETPKTNCRYEE